MRVTGKGDLIIVAFEDVSDKSFWGFKNKMPVVNYKETVKLFDAGVHVRNLVENVYNGELVLCDEQEKHNALLQVLESNKKIMQFTEDELEKADLLDSLKTGVPKSEHNFFKLIWPKCFSRQ